MEHWIYLISCVTDICPLRLIGSVVTVDHRAQRGAAADEAGRPHLVQSGPKDQSAPTDHTLKTHPHVLLIKTLLDPATESHPRGKMVLSATNINILTYSMCLKWSLRVVKCYICSPGPEYSTNLIFAFLGIPIFCLFLPFSYLDHRHHLAHPNDPGDRAPGHPRNQLRNPAPNQGLHIDLTKSQRRVNTDIFFFSSFLPQLLPPILCAMCIKID